MSHPQEESDDLVSEKSSEKIASNQSSTGKKIADRRVSDTGLERHRGPGRRRSDFIRSAEEGEMMAEQFLFIAAIDTYKRVNQKPFPTWTEVLEVIRKLGYRKTCPSTLSLANIDDWTESPDSPAFPEEASDGAFDVDEAAQ